MFASAKGGVYLVDVLSYIAKYVYFSPSVYYTQSGMRSTPSHFEASRYSTVSWMSISDIVNVFPKDARYLMLSELSLLGILQSVES